MTDMIRRFIDGWSSLDADALVGLMAEDVMYEDVPTGQILRGHEGIRGFVAQGAAFSSDLHVETVSEQESGSAYAFEWVMSGTNTGDSVLGPSSNKPYRTRGVSIGRRDDAGRIVEHRDYYDLVALLTQLGVMTTQPH